MVERGVLRSGVVVVVVVTRGDREAASRVAGSQAVSVALAAALSGKMLHPAREYRR